MKSYFVYKLIPPRPTFITDMNEAEKAIMGQHSAYWLGLMEQGIVDVDVVVIGPVLDPAGGWGLAVIQADSMDQVRHYAASDPAVKSGMATFDVFAMPRAAVRS